MSECLSEVILESLNELVHLEFLTDPKLQRILDFLSLRNLLSNELFFTFYYFVISLFYFFLVWYHIEKCIKKGEILNEI